MIAEIVWGAGRCGDIMHRRLREQFVYSWMIRHFAMPAVSWWTHSNFWPEYRRMLKLEKAPLEQLRWLQWQRLEKLLRHAYEHVPFYRDQMEQAGLTPGDIAGVDDLYRLPVTTKSHIQRNFPDRITADNSDRSDWQYVSTRGTANRLMAIHDFAKRDMVRATAARALHLSGDYRVGKKMVEIPPDICNIVCGDEGEEMEGVLRFAWQMTRRRQWRDRKSIGSLRGLIERGWIYRKRTYPPFGSEGTNLSPERLADYAQRLRTHRPHTLKALPTYLYEIARHVCDRREQPLPVRVVKTMGSSASAKMQRVIEQGFTGSYREDYGSAEFGDMACDCDRRQGLHVFMDLFLIEVVRDDKPVPAGELGKVLVTDLSNYAMPFLRYQIGDVGRLLTAPCPCGRTVPRLIVEGRLEDTVVTCGGKIFTNDQLMDYFYGRTDVSEFQIIEKQPGKMDLLVVPTNGDLPADQLKGDLRKLFDDEVEVNVFPVKTIKPEASGKFRFVKSASHERLG